MEAQALVIGQSIRVQLHKSRPLRSGFFIFVVSAIRKPTHVNPNKGWGAYNQFGRFQTTTLGAMVF
jgi:hypothetical protein